MVTTCRRPYDRLVAAKTQGRALTARAGAWYWALSPRGREIVQDTALALGLAVLNLLSVLGQASQISGPVWLAMFLAAVQCLPLAFRRVAPVLALICTGIPRNAYDVINFGYAPLPIAQAIAFATVAYQTRWPGLRWGTLVGTAAGISWAMTLPVHHLPYDAIVQFVIFGTAWILGTIFRSRRGIVTNLTHRAERAEAELDAVAARAASAAATERVRIARELHDVVAHHVSLMAVQAEAAGALLPDRPDAAAKAVDTIAATARQALAELRRLLGVLRAPSRPAAEDSPERPELTPAASLSRLHEVLDAVRAAGLPVTLTVAGDPAVLPVGVDLTAYRIVQEALTNALRHAPGSQASVQITYEDDAVTVRVADAGGDANGGGADGGGADSGGADSGGADGDARDGRGPGGAAGGAGLGSGYGLAGITERVASCGGSLTVGPIPAGGFAVTARLPMR
jgi:signal transduction histidine kinase